MVKKLRYLARFIVVCLLLKKSNQVKELIKDLSKNIDEYIKIYDPEDQLEWQLVKNEINDFIQADSIVNIDNTNIVLSNRLNAAQVPLVSPTALLPSEIQKSTSSILSANQMSLQEIIIVGNCQDQVCQCCLFKIFTAVKIYFLIIKRSNLASCHWICLECCKRLKESLRLAKRNQMIILIN